MTHRLSLELTQKQRDQMDRVRGMTGASSLSEVVHSALSVYEIVVETRRAGGKLVVVNPHGEKEVIIPL